MNYYTNTVKQRKIVKQVVKVVNGTVKSKHCQHPLDILPLHGRLWSVITAVEAEEIWPDFFPPAFLGSSRVPVCLPLFLHIRRCLSASLHISCATNLQKSLVLPVPKPARYLLSLKALLPSFFLTSLAICLFIYFFHTAVGLCLAWGFHNPK